MGVVGPLVLSDAAEPHPYGKRRTVVVRGVSSSGEASRRDRTGETTDGGREGMGEITSGISSGLDAGTGTTWGVNIEITVGVALYMTQNPSMV